MRLRLLLGILICGAAGYALYMMYDQLVLQRTLLDQVQQHLATLEVKHDTLVTRERNEQAACRPTGGSDWARVQSTMKDTVVQIFAHGAQFNWLEPYKTPNQFQASGSGFFINEEGDIITNAHVVNEAKAVYIQIPSMGKRRFEVDVIGVSPERDLALIRLKEKERELIVSEMGALRYLPIGDSDSVHRADEIMAVGYPLGQQSLKSTTGVVSGREHLEGHFMIQISAPINPGSSGGPSINCLGEVVGVNTAGITSAQNVGYIIPSNEVSLFLKQLDHVPQNGPIKFLRKPFLGVIFNNANEQVTTFLKNPLPGGLYVVEVYKGSPLQKAGVQPDDMIYEINGHKVDLFGEMSVPWSEDRVSIIDYVSRLMLGDTINLVVYRHGKMQKLSLQFNQSELAPVRVVYPAYEKIDYEVVGGMVFMQLAVNHLPLLLQGAPELSRYMDMKNQMEPAVIVTHVFPDSVAARTRTIGAGAIIKELNGQPIKKLEDVRKALAESPTSGYLTLKTFENVFTVMNWKQIIDQEKKLAAQYFYPLAKVIEESLSQQQEKAA